MLLSVQLARDEYNTWCLLDRYLRFSQSDRAGSPDASVAWMREVLAWLEGMVHAPVATGVRCGWDKTSRELASGRSPPGTIDAMDPDACSRQQRAVHPDDREMEDEFQRIVWKCVRAGDVSRAQACCRMSQQWWRAASLAPAEQGERGEARRVWKAACRDLARDISAPSFERAVYAVLSADPAALQAFGSTGKDGIQGVLSSWYDKVYVWAKVWVDSHDDGQPSSPVIGEEMKQSLDSFLHVCAAATEEDSLAGAVADSVDQNVASIAETWVNSAIHFYRGAQELLIFTAPILDDQTSCVALSRMWSGASDGVFPDSLRWPLTSNSWSAADLASLPTDIQQLGDDLSSQLTRTALHAGILLSQSTQTRSEEATVLITEELQNLGISYIELLTASLENGDSESCTLVAEYTNWLPQHVQADTLLKVLKDLSSSAWQSVLMKPVLQPNVVAEVSYKIVQHVISSSASDDQKLDALFWVCENIVNDGHDGLLVRIQGLRLVNEYLRMRLLEEGVEGLTGAPYAFLDVGRALCGTKMSDCFEAMRKSVSCTYICHYFHSPACTFIAECNSGACSSRKVWNNTTSGFKGRTRPWLTRRYCCDHLQLVNDIPMLVLLLTRTAPNRKWLMFLLQAGTSNLGPSVHVTHTHLLLVLGSSCPLRFLRLNAVKTTSESTTAGKCFSMASIVSQNLGRLYRALKQGRSSSTVWTTNKLSRLCIRSCHSKDVGCLTSTPGTTQSVWSNQLGLPGRRCADTALLSQPRTKPSPDTTLK